LKVKQDAYQLTSSKVKRALIDLGNTLNSVSKERDSQRKQPELTGYWQGENIGGDYQSNDQGSHYNNIGSTQNSQNLRQKVNFINEKVYVRNQCFFD
jgi:hypothetical protein